MKIAILSDTHIGLRNDSQIFSDLAEKFYSNVMFPYLKEHNIITVFQLGDLFDRRKYINFNTLAESKRYLFDRLQENGIEFHTILGNHDVFYKNTLGVNSTSLILGEYRNIRVYKEPTVVQFGELKVDVIPWICEENEKEVLKFIKKSKSPYCFAHLELIGFEMDRGNIMHDGMDASIFSKYEQVISGHYHHKSQKGNILYAGIPFEMCWADWNDEKGFHVLDTDTRELEFIPNPHTIYVKIPYNDDKLYFDDVRSHDFTQYKNKYVKVIVEKKSNEFLFDTLVESINKAEPIDMTIVEDFTDKLVSSESNSDSNGVNQSEDTLSIMDRVIDDIEIDLQKSKLKTMMRSIYNEAQGFE